MKSAITRSTKTVHTAVKARLISAAVWRIGMPVNHFPYLPIVANSENNLCTPVSKF